MNGTDSPEPSTDRIAHELDEGSAYANATLESLGVGIITTDCAGRITQMNASALRALGLDKRKTIGQTFSHLITATDQNGTIFDPIHTPPADAAIKNTPKHARLNYATNAGIVLPVTVTISAIVSHKKILGTVQVFRDISDELEFDQLKSEFISLASHQLRTPLTAISTYTHMLMSGFKGQPNEGQAEFLRTILTSADRMSNLIDTLLSVSRLESGAISITNSTVNVTKVISKVKQEVWPLAKTKSQYLITRAPEQDVIIHTDELLLAEICANLISNAIKYTPEEGTITIELKPEENGGIGITVNDTGYGIPIELQKRVFTKFFRAPNILHAESVGTGLGLYLVKEIITSLNGTIRFKSKEGKGSTFTVMLPDLSNAT